MPKFIFQQSPKPNLGSAYATRFAKHLFDFLLYMKDHRRQRDLYVRECDDAYMCRRYVPDLNGMELLEDGEFGETDIKDNATTVSIRLAMSLMDGRNPWLSVSSPEQDATPSVTNALRDYNIYLHKKAKTRRQMQRVFKQGFVRGSTYVHVDWHDTYRLRRLTNSENGPALQKYMADNGMTEKDARKFAIGRVEEPNYTGLVVTPIDFYDVWVEPFCDLTNPGQRPAHALQRFRRLSKLKSTVDEKGKTIYSNLDKVTEWDLEELYQNVEFMAHRVASERIMGNSMSASYKSNIKLIPVYIMYFPYLEFEGQEYWDTYFHLALSNNGNKPVLILIEENPDDTGAQHLIMDHWEDWFTQTPYGLSPVQFLISKLNQKNLLQLLYITGAAHGVLPPKLAYQDAFRNTEELSFMPGTIIDVLDNPLGLEVIKDLPMSAQGAMLGENFARFLSEDMKSSSGIDGLTADIAVRAPSKEKTAAEVNRDNAGGNYFLQNQAQNAQDALLEPLVQLGFQLAQIYQRPMDDNPTVLEYEKYVSGRAYQATLSMKDLQSRRSVQIVGVNGMMNEAQELAGLNAFFQVVGQIPDPRIAGLKLWLATQMAKKQNIQIPQEFEMSPEEAVAMNPAVQQAALQQALNNPEVQQIIVGLIQQAGGHLPGITQGQPSGQPGA